MPAVVDVPLNTSLADLDEALRTLLRRELERHGFEGVEIAFDAPASDWSAKLTAPTVNLFLYDLRENVGQSEASPRDVRVNGATMSAPPPMRLEVTYAVTAWTKAVEDEHRLLSQVLAILFSHTSLPADLLAGRLAERQPAARDRDRGRAPEGGEGGLLDVDRRPLQGVDRLRDPHRGRVRPDVHARARGAVADMRLELDGVRRTMEELQRFGGVVRDSSGEPVADAWVALPDLGEMTSSDREGRFLFDGLRPGDHKVEARTASGEEASGVAKVPGGGVDLELGGARRRSSSKRG